MAVSASTLSNPISDPDHLIGRETQLKEVVATLDGSQGGLRLLLGGPGCGKTSLLRVIQELLWRKLAGQPTPSPWREAPPTLPIWLATGETDSAVACAQQMVREMRSEARQRLGICQVDDDQLGLRLKRYAETADAGYLADAFGLVYTVLANRYPGLQVLALLDDGDELLARPWGPDFLTAVRAVLGLGQERRNRLPGWLIVTGGPELDEAVATGDSRLLTSDLLPVYLLAWDATTLERVVALASEWVGVAAKGFSRPLLDDLVRETGGHPYLLMSEVLPGLLESMREDTTGELAALVLETKRKQLPESQLWRRCYDQLTKPARVLFGALQVDTAGRTFAEAVRSQPLLLEDLEASRRGLKMLTYSGLIVEGADKRYAPAVPSWGLWFQSNAPDPKVIWTEAPRRDGVSLRVSELRKRHLLIRTGELQRQYQVLTDRIRDLDSDIGREMDQETKGTLIERRDQRVAERDAVFAELTQAEQELARLEE